MELEWRVGDGEKGEENLGQIKQRPLYHTEELELQWGNDDH